MGKLDGQKCIHLDLLRKTLNAILPSMKELNGPHSLQRSCHLFEDDQNAFTPLMTKLDDPKSLVHLTRIFT
jgi:hypothetical protein